MLTASIARCMPENSTHRPPSFWIERADAPSGAMLLVVAGELDIATSGRFRAHAEQALAEGVRLLVADLSEVAFIESTMLRELLRAREELEQAGARMVIAGAAEPVLRLLELTGTTGLFSLAETRSEALDSLPG